jgi:hypothetical protein
MLRLVETYLASAGKPDPGDRTPSCFLRFRTSDALLAERQYRGFQVVAHEIEFVPVILFGGMNRYLRRGQREDQPSAASVHG